MEFTHHLNIIVHVTAGTIALLTGLAAAFINKHSKKHAQFGKNFMWMILIVIITGLIGVFVFKRNNFLLVITLLSGYNCFSGIRAIRLHGQKPQWIDYLLSIIAIVSALYYLYYINSLGLYWSGVIVYSTIGSLFLVTIYDLFKMMLSVDLLKKAVMYEHTYKMLSALSAITSAFCGTVFPQYKPYSQFLPSLIGMTCIIVIFIRLNNNRYLKKRDVIPQLPN
ncbi:hypothetical protein H7F33_03715 [Pedobacter sp. PAMC26386]|nr:hypothetical protein H7F33_03715 [Pedobacter sp. PAMC26386]